MDTYRIFTDGGSRNNPGEAAIGVVVEHNDTCVHEVSRRIGIATNNVAEYQALIAALEYVHEKKLHGSVVEFFLDSKLVVEQVLGNWKVKEQTLVPYVSRAQELLQLCARASLTHVPRAKNAHADSLVNKALDAQ